MNRHSLFLGTLILTLAGLITRLMGFFYKIYLSNSMTGEGLGLYQLVFPIYGICYTLYASGIQTAISQLVAGRAAKKRRILKTGILLSVTIAIFLSLLLYSNASFIAAHVLMEPGVARSLQVLSFLFPFCGITACINGYYFGLKKTGSPSFSQLMEQLVRIFSVFFFSSILGGGNTRVSCELAVFGIVAGELAANLSSITSLLFEKHSRKNNLPEKDSPGNILRPLLTLSLPLTGTRLIVSLLHSLESVLIPYMLKVYGLSGTEALSIYGILTGMAMPFIQFPSTLVNSFSVMLLPTVSEAKGLGNTGQIKKTVSLSIKYSLLIGLYATCIFFIFGKSMGQLFFHNALSGLYMFILAWLCPFLYLSTTLSSIVNGLGKAHITFFNMVASLGLRILLLCVLIPRQGMSGYLTGLLVSQILITFLDYFAVRREISLTLDSINSLLKPGIILLFLGFLARQCYQYFSQVIPVSEGFLLLIFTAVTGIVYVIFLFMLKAISLKELK